MKVLDQNAEQYTKQREAFNPYNSNLTYYTGEKMSYSSLLWEAIDSNLAGSFNSSNWKTMGAVHSDSVVSTETLTSYLTADKVDSRITVGTATFTRTKGFSGTIDSFTTEEIVDISANAFISAVATVTPYGVNGGQRNMFIKVNDDDSVIVAIDSSYIEAINFRLLVSDK